MAAQNKTPQNLSPDLKQIYDRVMNTPAKTPPGTATPPLPPQPASNPVIPPPQPTPTVTPPAPTMASETTPQPSSEPFLTSTPPKPLDHTASVKSYAIGQDKKESAPTPQPAGAKKVISKPIIIVLGVVFFAVWIFFWFIFFFQPFS